MNAIDSSNLMDAPDAGRLGVHRAIYYDDRSSPGPVITLAMDFVPEPTVRQPDRMRQDCGANGEQIVEFA